MDLWAEFRLLDMGERLGKFIGQYRTQYFLPDKRNGQVVFSYKPLPGAEEKIYGKISDITISMKATDHLKMPELVNSRYTVYLSEEEMERYGELKKELVLQLPDGDITAANAASPLREAVANGKRGGIFRCRRMSSQSMTESWTPWRTSSRRQTESRACGVLVSARPGTDHRKAP